MTSFLTRLRSNTEGNALMLFAAALIPITLMIGSGVDASITYNARNKLQNACDSGALAGRLAMIGTEWNDETESEARKFFDFNFPAGTHGVEDATFSIDQDEDDPAQLIGSAIGTVPTSMMFIFGYNTMDIAVMCDARKDLGHHDVMLVLDMTTSMKNPPDGDITPKRDLMQEAVMDLYRSIDDGDPETIVRFGFMPFGASVNIGRSLRNQDIVKEQYFLDTEEVCDDAGECVVNYLGKKVVGARDSFWNNGQNGAATENAIIQGFRTGGQACVEERPSYGDEYNEGEFKLKETIALEDINEISRNGNDVDLQFGRYEPPAQGSGFTSACPDEAIEFAVYETEEDFEDAVIAATTTFATGTFWDTPMIWGMRFSSRDGMLKSKNPKKYGEIPVNAHIIFLSDGRSSGAIDTYASTGLEKFQNRVAGDGVWGDFGVQSWEASAARLTRFNNACLRAKSMGMTVWTISVEIPDQEEMRECATSTSHYFDSDGTDLSSVFSQIGGGIGRLRLTR